MIHLNDRIVLKFKTLHLVTAFGWASILFLGLITRGVLSDAAFYLIVIVISLLFILDIIYLIARVTQGHYILITPDEVKLKRYFKEMQTIRIKSLKSIKFIKTKYDNEYIILSDGANQMEIRQNYNYTKRDILHQIKATRSFSDKIDIIKEDYSTK